MSVTPFLMKMLARYTGGSDEEVSASADKQRNLLISQGNPEYMETRRRGEGWNVMTSTALTPLVVLPTGTARLELHNHGSRVAVISDLHAYKLLGTAVTEGEVIFAMITTVKAVPSLTAQVLYSMTGKASVTPTAASEMVTGVGTTVVTGGWQPYGLPSMTLCSTVPGTGFSVPIDGKLQIPPDCSLCLQLCASIAEASSWHIGVTFDWVTMTQES